MYNILQKQNWDGAGSCVKLNFWTRLFITAYSIDVTLTVYTHASKVRKYCLNEYTGIVFSFYIIVM